MKYNVLKPISIYLTYFVLIFIVIIAFLTQSLYMKYAFNSDALYLPAVFSDVFINGHNFFSWHLTPAPYFFPDMFLFFLINSAARNFFFAFIFFAMIQTSLTLLLASKLAMQATHNKCSILLTHIGFILIVANTAVNNVSPFNLILMNAFHFGAFLSGLILLFFLIKPFSVSEHKVFVAVFIISALSTASDLFFVIWFVAPIMASLAFTRLFFGSLPFAIKKLFFVLIMGGLFGFFIKSIFFYDASAAYISLPGLHWSKFIQFYTVFIKVFLQAPIACTWMLIFYVYLFFQCISFIVTRNNTKTKANTQLIFFLILFILFSALFATTNIIVSNLHELKIDRPAFRYIINVYWFPVVFLWLPFYVTFSQYNVKKTLSICLNIVLLIVILEKIFPPLVYRGIYYPELVYCIDAGVKKYNDSHAEKIKYGIAGYWQAKLTTFFSTQGVEVMSFLSNLTPNLIISTPRIYRSVYDFAIISNKDQMYQLNVALIKEINGKPVSEFQCANEITVMIYGENKLHLPSS